MPRLEELAQRAPRRFVRRLEESLRRNGVPLDQLAQAAPQEPRGAAPTDPLRHRTETLERRLSQPLQRPPEVQQVIGGRLVHVPLPRGLPCRDLLGRPAARLLVERSALLHELFRLLASARRDFGGQPRREDRGEARLPDGSREVAGLEAFTRPLEPGARFGAPPGGVVGRTAAVLLFGGLCLETPVHLRSVGGSIPWSPGGERV